MRRGVGLETLLVHELVTFGALAAGLGGDGRRAHMLHICCVVQWQAAVSLELLVVEMARSSMLNRVMA